MLLKSCDMAWYTDECHAKTRQDTGAGINRAYPKRLISISLGRCTVLQAEVRSIAECIQECIGMEYTNKSIFLFTGSKAAKRRLNLTELPSAFHHGNDVPIVWIPGYLDYKGTERAVNSLL